MQINHAGDGGLYPEMIRDRSFEAIAAYSSAKTYANDTSKPAASYKSNSSALIEATKSLEGWVTPLSTHLSSCVRAPHADVSGRSIGTADWAMQSAPTN